MKTKCLKCGKEGVEVADVRGELMFEMALADSLIDSQSPLHVCMGCMADIYCENMNNPMDEALRHSEPNSFEAANLSHNSVEGTSAPASSSSGSGPVGSEEIVEAPNSDSQRTGESQYDMPPPPTDPRLAAEYKRIVKLPGPKAAKRQRLMNLNRNQEPINVRQMLRNRSRSRSGRSSSTDSSQPHSSEEIVPAPINSEVIIPSQNILDRSPSHSSSNGADHGNNSSFGSVASIPQMPSPPLPPTVRPRADGNAHSNVAAPRRIFTSYPVVPSRDARNVNMKNAGG